MTERIDARLPGLALPDGVDRALAAAPALASELPGPGDGATARLWSALATWAAHDLGVARALEPHLDAVAILRQAGEHAPRGTWGVFAAEGGDEPLTARAVDGGWSLRGMKPWCSLADRLDAALVTAHTDAGRSLFAVDLRHPGVAVQSGAWHARGLTEIPSGPVRFDDVPARPVGDAGWYLSRPGFAWGGIGVAACWYGGAVGVARALHRAMQQRDDELLRMHLGAVDERLHSARRALEEAARLIDEQPDAADSVLAKRVRATVAAAGEAVIARTGHALGPAPLATDAEHAKRVADLTLYLRQHHAERDLASLGRSVADGPAPW